MSRALLRLSVRVKFKSTTVGVTSLELLRQKGVHFTTVQQGNAFVAHVLLVPVGADVEFPNHDGIFHIAFSLFNGKRFDLGLYESGSSKRVKFDRPGIAYVFCKIHCTRQTLSYELRAGKPCDHRPMCEFRNQLTQVTQGGSTTESYSYDAVGNRLSSIGMPLYSYNSSNELTSTSQGSYTYDSNGNTIADALGRSFSWDFENRLLQVVNQGVGTATFKYAPFGRGEQGWGAKNPSAHYEPATASAIKRTSTFKRRATYSDK